MMVAPLRSTWAPAPAANTVPSVSIAPALLTAVFTISSPPVLVNSRVPLFTSRFAPVLITSCPDWKNVGA